MTFGGYGGVLEVENGRDPNNHSREMKWWFHFWKIWEKDDKNNKRKVNHYGIKLQVEIHGIYGGQPQGWWKEKGDGFPMEFVAFLPLVH